MQPAPSSTQAALRPLLLAIVCYVAFLILGLLVAHRPPTAADLWAHALLGHGNLIAWILAWSVYVPWLAPLTVVMIVIAVVRPQWRARIAVSLLLLIVMWGASDLLQHVYSRVRPLDWVVKHETAFSFPSTHATLAMAFYGYWAYVLKRSELPPRIGLVASELLTALVIAILWSRLALGAHYPTDILGGILLGTTGIGVALSLCAFLRIRLYPRFLGD